MNAPRVALLAGIVALAAGCGGGSKPPSVASLSQSHSGTTTQSAAPDAVPAAPSGGPSGQFNVAMRVPSGTTGEKFSECMRGQGLPDFPDPNGQGVIQFGSGSGVDPSSPKFQAARKVCDKLLPNGGQPTPAQIAKAQQSALEHSACMRSHGIKDFPDPDFTGGGIRLSVGGPPGSDLDPNSPLFRRAQAACQGFLAFKGPATGGAGGK